jgi:DNA-binding transcriptional MerR regulator
MTKTAGSRTRARKTPAPVIYTTQEVLAMTGMSFRVLDYWLRTKVIVLVQANTPGSGHQRLYTAGEAAAIARLWERYKAARGEIAAVRTGQAWMQELGIEEQELVS